MTWREMKAKEAEECLQAKRNHMADRVRNGLRAEVEFWERDGCECTSCTWTRRIEPYAPYILLGFAAVVVGLLVTLIILAIVMAPSSKPSHGSGPSGAPPMVAPKALSTGASSWWTEEPWAHPSPGTPMPENSRTPNTNVKLPPPAPPGPAETRPVLISPRN